MGISIVGPCTVCLKTSTGISENGMCARCDSFVKAKQVGANIPPMVNYSAARLAEITNKKRLRPPGNCAFCGTVRNASDRCASCGAPYPAAESGHPTSAPPPRPKPPPPRDTMYR